MSHWTFGQETQFLVFRDTSSPGKDFRIAFFPDKYKDFGKQVSGNETGVMKQFANWSIDEETASSSFAISSPGLETIATRSSRRVGMGTIGPAAAFYTTNRKHC